MKIGTKLFVAAAMTAGALALPATGAFASVHNPFPNGGPPQGGICQQDDRGCDQGGCNTFGDRDNCGDPGHLVCTPVRTPFEPNFTYVENTQGVKVIVTLFGKYFWIQVKDTNGHITFLGPDTTTVILLPGQWLSVAWHPNTGDHNWHWIGEKCTPCLPVVKFNPCLYDRDDCAPCQPVVTNFDPRPCDPPVVTSDNPCQHHQHGDNGPGNGDPGQGGPNGGPGDGGHGPGFPVT